MAGHVSFNATVDKVGLEREKIGGDLGAVEMLVGLYFPDLAKEYQAFDAAWQKGEKILEDYSDTFSGDGERVQHLDQKRFYFPYKSEMEAFNVAKSTFAKAIVRHGRELKLLPGRR
jgi:hypothetical protein